MVGLGLQELSYVDLREASCKLFMFLYSNPFRVNNHHFFASYCNIQVKGESGFGKGGRGKLKSKNCTWDDVKMETRKRSGGTRLCRMALTGSS